MINREMTGCFMTTRRPLREGGVEVVALARSRKP